MSAPIPVAPAPRRVWFSDATRLVKGRTYRVRSVRRKGEIVGKCVAVFDDGGEFLVLKGELRGIYAVESRGDLFATINNLSRFCEVTA